LVAELEVATHALAGLMMDMQGNWIPPGMPMPPYMGQPGFPMPPYMGQPGWPMPPYMGQPGFQMPCGQPPLAPPMAPPSYSAPTPAPRTPPATPTQPMHAGAPIFQPTASAPQATVDSNAPPGQSQPQQAAPDPWTQYLLHQQQTGGRVATQMSPPTAPQVFQGLGAVHAGATITGILANELLKHTHTNIAYRIAARTQPNTSMRQLAGDLMAKDGPKSCPAWDGKDPGKTLRPWLRSQLFWQTRTPTQPEQWGILLYEALHTGSLSKLLAEGVPDTKIASVDGYIEILTKILVAHQAYLEVELERATLDCLYPGRREKQELFTSFVARLEILGNELDRQLHPAPPLDERIKAIILLKHAEMDVEQHRQLALKRAGTQPFREVADLLIKLDRPEAFIQASQAAAPARKALFPVINDPSTLVTVNQSGDQQTWIEGPAPMPAQLAIEDGSQPEQWELDSDSTDGEGGPMLEFDPDAEYEENESLQILAFHGGRQSVRTELNHRKNERGFRRTKPFDSKPTDRKARPESRVPSGTKEDLLAKTRCCNCDELGHLSRDCKKPRKASVQMSGSRRGFFSPPQTSGRPTPSQSSKSSSPAKSRRFFYTRGNDGTERRLSIHMITAAPFVGLMVHPHEAVVDTAAEDGCIGTSQLPSLAGSLAQHGLQFVWQQTNGSAAAQCTGIGGAAKWLGRVMIPAGIAGVNGLIQAHVVDDSESKSIPLLLSLEVQDGLGFVIDMEDNSVWLKKCPNEDGSARTTPMRVIEPSHHRGIAIDEFDGPWALHDDDPDKISEDKFRLKETPTLAQAIDMPIAKTDPMPKGPKTHLLSTPSMLETELATETMENSVDDENQDNLDDSFIVTLLAQLSHRQTRHLSPVLRRRQRCACLPGAMPKPQTLAESSDESSEWELVTAVARRPPEKILKIEKAWCRIGRAVLFTMIGKRILFAETVANQNKVVKRWERLVTKLDQAPLAQPHSAKTASAPIRKPCRDDMCYVGQPVQRMECLRTFSYAIRGCPHEGMLIPITGGSGDQPI